VLGIDQRRVKDMISETRLVELAEREEKRSYLRAAESYGSDTLKMIEHDLECVRLQARIAFHMAELARNGQ